ncbi:MAG: CHAT domain-containing tetratricopeptide repeat protein [bacterium]
MSRRVSPPLSVLLALLFLVPAFAQAAGPTPATQAALAPIDSLWGEWLRDEALAEVEAAIPQARAAADSSLLAHLLWRQGNFLVARGGMAAASAPLEEAVLLAEALRDTSALCAGLRWLSLTTGNRGEAERTRSILERLIDTAAAVGDRRHQGWGHVGLAYQAWTMGRAQAALDHYEKAAGFFEGTEDVEGTIWAHSGIALARSDAGEYPLALESYRYNLDQARTHNLPAAEATALNNLGTLEYSLGRADLALEHFEEALAVSRRIGRLQSQSTPMHNIALCLAELGRIEEARRTLEDALRISQEVGFQQMIDNSRLKLAEHLYATGKGEEARLRFQEIVADSQEVRIHTLTDALLGLASISQNEGGFAEAVALLERAEYLLSGGQDHYRLLKVRGRRGLVLLGAGRTQEALEVFRRTTADARRSGIQDFVVDGLYEIGRSHLRLDRPDSALAYFRASADEWERERKLLLSPQWREQRGVRGARIFPDLVRLLWLQGEREAAWDRLQAYKARTLLERMLGPGRRFDRVMADEGPATVRLPEFRETVLKPGDLLLDYALGRDLSVVLAVTLDTLALVELPPEPELSARVHDFHALLGDPDAGSPTALRSVSGHMTDLVLGGLAPLAAAGERVIVCPDGVLNLLPFGILPLSQPDPGEGPLWTRTPSASILARLLREQSPPAGTRDAHPWTMAAFAGAGEGGNLPGTDVEADWLARTFAGVEHHHSPGADPGSMGSILTGRDILHIASHTEINDQSPWQSAVIISGGSESGRWQADAIAGQDLDVRLAVLSSCSTGSGRVISGEGVMGLTAAFFSAGVPAVVSSLWPVDDGATGDFMKAFYLSLGKGMDVAGALAEAQARLRSQPATAHPCYWAGFVAAGDGRQSPQIARRSSPGRMLAWLAIPLLVAALAIRRARR